MSQTPNDPPLRVFDLKPLKDQASKPRELIKITGHESLSLTARRAITVLWHSAHRQGLEAGKDYVVEINDLRPSNTRNNDIVVEAILALMKTIITVPLPNGGVRQVQFLGGNDITDQDRPYGVLTYSFDKRLVEILQDSKIWGSISLPVLMSLSSKYAVSLYELASQWVGLNRKTSETIPIEELRSLLGVDLTKYPTFGGLNKYVLQPAITEINALAPFSLTMLLIKTGRKVTHVRIHWRTKRIEEHKLAWDELHRPKVGRKARIQKDEEVIIGPVTGFNYLTHKHGKD